MPLMTVVEVEDSRLETCWRLNASSWRVSVGRALRRPC